MGGLNAHSNQYWKGNGGQVWLNDVVWDRLKSFELKLIPEWEEVPDGMTTKRVLLGMMVEGSFVYRKTDLNYNNIITEIAEYYMKGIIPDVSLIVKDENVATGTTQRFKVTNLTFDEVDIISWEEKALTEIELAFVAEKVVPLE